MTVTIPSYTQKVARCTVAGHFLELAVRQLVSHSGTQYQVWRGKQCIGRIFAKTPGSYVRYTSLTHTNSLIEISEEEAFAKICRDALLKESEDILNEAIKDQAKLVRT